MTNGSAKNYLWLGECLHMDRSQGVPGSFADEKGRRGGGRCRTSPDRTRSTSTPPRGFAPHDPCQLGSAGSQVRPEKVVDVGLLFLLHDGA